METEALKPVYASRYHLEAQRVSVEIADLPQLKTGASRPGLPVSLQTMPIVLVSDQSSGREILNAESVQAELDMRPETSAIFVYEVNKESLSPIEHRFVVFYYKFVDPAFSKYKSKEKFKKTLSEMCTGIIGKLLSDEDLLDFCLNTLLPEHRTLTATFTRLLFNHELSESSCDKAVKNAKAKINNFPEHKENKELASDDFVSDEFTPQPSPEKTGLESNSQGYHSQKDAYPSSTVDNDSALANDCTSTKDHEELDDFLSHMEDFIDKYYSTEKPRGKIQHYTSFK